MTLDTIHSTVLAQSTVLAHDHWNGPGHWWPIIPLVWLLVVATLVTFCIRGGRRRARFSGQRAGERALAERYAAGDIDDAEYHRRLGVLRSTNSA